MPTYYDVLGVDPKASAVELQRAYRARALAVHPDLAGDDDSMRALNEAWEVLRAPERRARYDRSLGLAEPSPGVAGGPAPLPPPTVPPLRLTLWMVVVAVLFLIFVVTAYAGHVSP